MVILARDGLHSACSNCSGKDGRLVRKAAHPHRHLRRVLAQRLLELTASDHNSVGRSRRVHSVDFLLPQGTEVLDGGGVALAENGVAEDGAYRRTAGVRHVHLPLQPLRRERVLVDKLLLRPRSGDDEFEAANGIAAARLTTLAALACHRTPELVHAASRRREKVVRIGHDPVVKHARPVFQAGRSCRTVPDFVPAERERLVEPLLHLVRLIRGRLVGTRDRKLHAVALDSVQRPRSRLLPRSLLLDLVDDTQELQRLRAKRSACLIRLRVRQRLRRAGRPHRPVDVHHETRVGPELEARLAHLLAVGDRVHARKLRFGAAAAGLRRGKGGTGSTGFVLRVLEPELKRLQLLHESGNAVRRRAGLYMTCICHTPSGCSACHG